MPVPMSEFIKSLTESLNPKGHQSPDTNHPFYRKQLNLQYYYTEYQSMDISSFDPNSFLDATVTEASTTRPLLPAGRDFISTLGEPKSRKWTKKDDPSIQGIAVDIPHEFDVSAMPPEVQKLYSNADGTLSITKIIISDGIMLDMIPGPGGQPMIDLAPGKNAKLRRYREALDLNVPGAPFNIRMFQGRNIRAKIKHEPYDGNNFDKIDAVAKI